jgi:hypothetical protein
MDNKLPVKYVTLDPPRRGSENRTVSYACSRCSSTRTIVRHTHGAPGCSGRLGESIGSRGSHCDGFGDYELVIGDESKNE